MIAAERFKFLEWAWGEESEDPESQEWREELTKEEQQLVSSWDKSFNIGVRILCEQILKRDVSLARMHKPYFNA